MSSRKQSRVQQPAPAKPFNGGAKLQRGEYGTEAHIIEDHVRKMVNLAEISVGGEMQVELDDVEIRTLQRAYSAKMTDITDPIATGLQIEVSRIAKRRMMEGPVGTETIFLDVGRSGLNGDILKSAADIQNYALSVYNKTDFRPAVDQETIAEVKNAIASANGDTELIKILVGKERGSIGKFNNFKGKIAFEMNALTSEDYQMGNRDVTKNTNLTYIPLLASYLMRKIDGNKRGLFLAYLVCKNRAMKDLLESKLPEDARAILNMTVKDANPTFLPGFSLTKGKIITALTWTLNNQRAQSVYQIGLAKQNHRMKQMRVMIDLITWMGNEIRNGPKTPAKASMCIKISGALARCVQPKGKYFFGDSRIAPTNYLISNTAEGAVWTITVSSGLLTRNASGEIEVQMEDNEDDADAEKSIFHSSMRRGDDSDA